MLLKTLQCPEHPTTKKCQPQMSAALRLTSPGVNVLPGVHLTCAGAAVGSVILPHPRSLEVGTVTDPQLLWDKETALSQQSTVPPQMPTVTNPDPVPGNGVFQERAAVLSPPGRP